MIATETPRLDELYDTDETAWLEAMADLAARGCGRDLDYFHLAEYLSDMAKRDRREVESRLTIVLAHLLKWQYQPDQRSRSWQLTVAAQRQELRRLLTSRTLRNHARDMLATIYMDGVEQAAIETGMSPAKFPQVCPYTLEEVLEVIELTDPAPSEAGE